MKLFELFATLVLDDSEFNRGITQATSKGESFGKTLTTKAVAGAVALGNAMYDAGKKAASLAVEFTKAAIETAAQVQAEQAQFSAAFAGMEEEAANALKAVGTESGILYTRLQTVGTKVFSQLKGSGLDAAESLEAMERYTRLAADAAAYYDISLEDADERLRSFMRGNTEAGDAIGLFTSESQRNTYALEEYGKKWEKLTEAQKQMLMLNVAEDIYNQSGAIGQASRESDNWANKVANLEEAWEQAVALFGTPVGESLKPMLDALTAFLQNESNQKLFTAFGQKVADIASASFENLTKFFESVQTDGTTANDTLDSMIDFWTDIKTAVAENEEAVKLLFGVIGGAALLSHPVIAGLVLVAAKWTDIKNFVSEEALPAIENFFAYTIPTTWEEKVVTPVTKAWGNITTGVGNAFDTVSTFFNETIPSWWEEKVPGPIKAAWNAITGAISGATNAVRTFLGLNSPSPTYTPEEIEAAQQYGDPMGFIPKDQLPMGGSAVLGKVLSFSAQMAVAVNKTSGILNAVKKHAVGLDYVPYNNYAAMLHEGEAVLTKSEARAWRGGDGSGVFMELLDEIRSLRVVAEAMNGLTMEIDGEKVGEIVAPTVSRKIAGTTKARRYAFT